MEAKKVVAVFVMCMVVLSAVHVQVAEADEIFKRCFDNCQKECADEGHGYTFCEMKCDADCGMMELKAKIENLKH
ncbi:PREDICTED: major pollen allergen Ole e 6-like [Nicotiana attenuata]|uniref:Major pollen allergen ole e 6 n=1 Tax=Nicotiana attenuata TaxID=49451 RepID=A0A314LBA3_NICAT|nr:PREDICTED: major pollen allergen Ole e 6-like [Nicotiana attenuata]OIT38407.1 major pollen allergen ole e 6 [Nicotiana attenuata]